MDEFAELVCSNSLRSNEMTNAVGTLKEEMRMLNSLIIRTAEYAQVPACGSLAVDRVLSSKYITKKINFNDLIEVIDAEVEKIDPNEINLIASSPLTTDKLQNKY